MTYTIDDTSTMVLTDVGDTFAVDPMLIFYVDGKEVPVHEVLPHIREIEISENFAMDGYDMVVTNQSGRTTSDFFPTLEDVAADLVNWAKTSGMVYAREPRNHSEKPTDASTTAAEPSDDTQSTLNNKTDSDIVLDAIKKDMDHILRVSTTATVFAQEAISAQEEGRFADAHRHCKHAALKVYSIVTSVIGFIGLSSVEALMDYALTFYGRADPRCWGYIAGEFHTQAAEYLSWSIAYHSHSPYIND